MPQAHTRYPPKSAVTRVVELSDRVLVPQETNKRNSSRNRSHVVKSEEKPGIVLRGEEDTHQLR